MTLILWIITSLIYATIGYAMARRLFVAQVNKRGRYNLDVFDYYFVVLTFLGWPGILSATVIDKLASETLFRPTPNELARKRAIEQTRRAMSEAPTAEIRRIEL